MSASYDFLWSLDRRMRGQELRMGLATVKGYDLDGYTNSAKQFVFIVPAANDWIEAEHIPARVATEYPPRPGAAVWYGTDGNDYYVMGILGPEGPPTALTTLTADTTVTTGAGSATFPGMTIFDDPWNMVESNGTAIRIPVSGLYSVYAQPGWNTGTVGYRNVAIYRNNGIIVRDRVAPINAALFHVVSRSPAYLEAGDLLSVGVFHTQGADLVLSSLQFGVTYVGNQRTYSPGNALTTTVNPNNDDNTWSTAGASGSVTFNNVNGTAFVLVWSSAGTTLSSVYSPEVIPVVPRQKYVISAFVNEDLASGTGGGTVQYMNMSLLCAAQGVPDPNLVTTATATGPTNLLYMSTATYRSWSFGTVTIPDGMYTARPAFYANSTGTMKAAYFGDISVTEVVQ